MLVRNNKVFVACEAQTMKIRLSETEQALHGFILYGLYDENVDFLNVVMFCGNLALRLRSA